MVNQCALDISGSAWGPNEGLGECGNDFWTMVT